MLAQTLPTSSSSRPSTHESVIRSWARTDWDCDVGSLLGGSVELAFRIVGDLPQSPFQKCADYVLIGQSNNNWLNCWKSLLEHRRCRGINQSEGTPGPTHWSKKELRIGFHLGHQRWEDRRKDQPRANRNRRVRYSLGNKVPHRYLNRKGRVWLCTYAGTNEVGRSLQLGIW